MKLKATHPPRATRTLHISHPRTLATTHAHVLIDPPGTLVPSASYRTHALGINLLQQKSSEPPARWRRSTTGFGC